MITLQPISSTARRGTAALLAAACGLFVLPVAADASADTSAPDIEILSPLPLANVMGNQAEIVVRTTDDNAVKAAATQLLVRDLDAGTNITLPTSFDAATGILSGVADLTVGHRYEITALSADLDDNQAVVTWPFSVIDLNIPDAGYTVSETAATSITPQPDGSTVIRFEDIPLYVDSYVVDVAGTLSHPGLGYVQQIIDLSTWSVDLDYGVASTTTSQRVSAPSEWSVAPVYQQLDLLHMTAPTTRVNAVDAEITHLEMMLPAGTVAPASASIVEMQGVGIGSAPVCLVEYDRRCLEQEAVENAEDEADDAKQQAWKLLPAYSQPDPTPVYYTLDRAAEIVNEITYRFLDSASELPLAGYDTIVEANQDAEEPLEDLLWQGMGGRQYLLHHVDANGGLGTDVVRMVWDKTAAIYGYYSDQDHPLYPTGVRMKYYDGLPYPILPASYEEDCERFPLCDMADALASDTRWDSPADVTRELLLDYALYVEEMGQEQDQACINEDGEQTDANTDCFQNVFAVMQAPDWDAGANGIFTSMMINEYGWYDSDFDAHGFTFNVGTDGAWETDSWESDRSYVARVRNYTTGVCETHRNLHRQHHGYSMYQQRNSNDYDYTDINYNDGSFGMGFYNGRLRQTMGYHNWDSCGFKPGNNHAITGLQFSMVKGTFNKLDRVRPASGKGTRQGIAGMTYVHNKDRTSTKVNCTIGYPGSVGCGYETYTVPEHAWELKPSLQFTYSDKDG